MALLRKHKPLTTQAEDLDTIGAYHELIDIIRGMSYEELHDILWQTEVILKVLVRREAKGDDAGI